MAIKVNRKWRGESPEEEFQIEKTRFSNRKKLSNKKIVNLLTGQTYLYFKKEGIEVKKWR